VSGQDSPDGDTLQRPSPALLLLCRSVPAPDRNTAVVLPCMLTCQMSWALSAGRTCSIVSSVVPYGLLLSLCGGTRV